jgi:hypothetical protein
MHDKRTFTVKSSGIKKNGGRYISQAPSAAAKKAATKLFKKASASRSQITFELRETTRGSDNKTFKYTGRRTKLATPKVIEIGGKEVTYSHKISVEADTIGMNKYSHLFNREARQSLGVI